MPTSSIAYSLLLAAATFASALIGVALRHLLGEKLGFDDSREMIGGVAGLTYTLLALVLGLLIWTAFGVFSTQKAELQLMAEKAIEFDHMMKEYGPEGARARELLRTDLVWAHEQFWGDDDSRAAAYDASAKNIDALEDYLRKLEAPTETQKALRSGAQAAHAAIGQNRILMSLQGIDAVSWPLIHVVSLWACFSFFLSGVTSKPKPATFGVAALGSALVASAFFLILEFSQPYASSVRLSSDGIDQVILNLEQP